jgi:hypothetical protein
MSVQGEALVVVGAAIWSATGCTSSTTGTISPDASTTSDGGPEGPSNDAAVAISDAPAARCSVTPYPNGLVCTDPTAVCVPEAGWDCCRCLATTNCKYTNQWACESSHPLCPQMPPTVGTTCSLPQYAGCIYCDQAAVVVACTNGTWQAVDNHLYCQTSD